MGQDFLKKLVFAKNGNYNENSEHYNYFLCIKSNFSHQSRYQGIVEKKTVLEDISYWQNGSEIEKGMLP